MNVEFHVSESFTDAMKRLRDSRRKGGDDSKAVNAAMVALIVAAMAKTPVAKPEVIEAYFLQPARFRKPNFNKGRTARGAYAEKYRNTRGASFIASVVNGKSGREARMGNSIQKLIDDASANAEQRRAHRVVTQIRGRTATIQSKAKSKKIADAAADTAFYFAVHRYLKRAIGRRGYHKKGFIPALKEFKQAARGIAGYVMKNPPGRGKKAAKTEEVPTAEIANFARAIATLLPQWPERDAIQILENLIARNLEERKREAGLA